MDWGGVTDFVYILSAGAGAADFMKNVNSVFLVLTDASENGNWHIIGETIQSEI